MGATETFAYSNPNSWKELFEEMMGDISQYQENEETLDNWILEFNKVASYRINEFMELLSIKHEKDTLKINLAFNGPIIFFLVPYDELETGEFTGKKIPRAETVEKLMILSMPQQESEAGIIPFLTVNYLALGNTVQISVAETIIGEMPQELIVTLSPDGNIKPIETVENKSETRLAILDPNAKNEVRDLWQDDILAGEDGAGSGDNRADYIFQAVEKPAEFPGGQMGLMTWLSNNIRYPEAAQQARVEGRVIVKFVIEKDGTVSNAVVVKGVNKDLDAEALRVVRRMPKWIPGENDGKPVASYFTLPIQYKLTVEEPKPQEEAVEK